MKKLLLIIPAYNEEKNIDRVMKELLLEYQIYDEFDYLTLLYNFINDTPVS